MSSTNASSESDSENYLQFSSSTSLDSLYNNNNHPYKSTCDIIPSLINHELSKVTSGNSIVNQSHLSNKCSIYDLVSTIRLVDKKLDHITVKTKTKKILIVTKIYDIGPVLDTLEIIKYLLTSSPKAQLFIQDELLKIEEFKLAELSAEHPEFNIEHRIKYWSAKACSYNPDTFDLIITLGGDGTILFTSWLFQELIPPVLSFSLGSLGFLTQFNFSEYQDVLSEIMKNGYQCLIRTRFECTVMKSKRNNQQHLSKLSLGNDSNSSNNSNNSNDKRSDGTVLPIYQSANILNESKTISFTEGTANTNGKICLRDQVTLADELKDEESINKTHYRMFRYSIFNDIVVDRGPNPTMTSVDLYSDNELLTNVEADGCVIATPSGSTAYSLSAGGSLVHPEIPGILISPICAHSLSFRPLVIPESIILRIGVPYDARYSAWCSFDGKNRVELEPGDFVTVTASRFPIPFVKNTASKNEWFKRLSDTLHWNERKRQKPFNNLALD